MKKFLSILASSVMALVLFVGTGTTVNAAGTGTITITPPTNTDSSASTTYSVYKVFDADGNGTNISYKLLAGKKTSDAAWTTSHMDTYFDVDAAGNVTALPVAKVGGTGTNKDDLSAGAINAVKAYVSAENLQKAAADVTVTGTNNAVFSSLANGYYYVTTTTGTAVTITSTNPNAVVNDKNVAPTVDKKITNANSLDDDGKKALAEVGSTVTYTATVILGNGSQNVKFHDVMGTGLTYNNDVKVYTDAAHRTEAGNNVVTSTKKEGNDALTVTFADGKEGTYYIVYSATVNSDALTVDTGKNTATVSYGNNSNTTSTPSNTEVRNAKITVIKNFEGGDLTNDSAEFVLKNSEGKYYKFTAKTGDTSAKVEWVNDESSATKLTFTNSGDQKEFTGLADGTYTVTESKVPAGFNKAADQTVTINNAKDANVFADSNLAKTTTFQNKKGSALPSTGGIGTTMFYVAGAALIAIAAVALGKKKAAE